MVEHKGSSEPKYKIYEGNVHGGKKLMKDKRCLGVYVTAEMYKDLIDLANDEQLTISDIVRRAIKEYLKSYAY